jgi:predicted enzyme related to lactoylglutathione lyase
MSDVTWAPGTVVWREVLTTDVEKSKGFYGELFGWTYQEVEMGPDYKYPMITVGGRAIGGIARAQDAGAPPHWVSYVSVPDVDASCNAAKAGGGKVTWGPMDVPGVGRLATIADFGGARIAFIRGATGDVPPPAQPPLGTFCWEALSTSDLGKARDYYAAVCGWKVGPGFDANNALFSTARDEQVADAHGLPQGAPVPPNWVTYVLVDKLDAARDKAVRLGARVIEPRIDLPTVGAIAHVTDPQGAAIGLFEPVPRG